MEKGPSLSAIVIAFDGTYTLIEKTVQHLAHQTVVDQIELLIISPEEHVLEAGREAFAPFHSYQLVVDEMGTIADAYAQGIRSAAADIVVFCEDHCFPAPDWAGYLIAAHKEGWGAVGPSICNANPGSLMSWASISIDYSEWLDPVESGARSHIPGHNSSYKKSLLLEYGADLEMMLEAESVLHWDLQAKGHQVYLEARAKTYHLNFEKFSSWAVVLFYASRRFAACRAKQFNWPKRLVFIAGSPLIPLIRLVKINRELRKPGRFSGNRLALNVVLFSGLLVWGLGELLGYTFGLGDSQIKATPFEFDRFRYLKKQPVGEILF